MCRNHAFKTTDDFVRAKTEIYKPSKAKYTKQGRKTMSGIQLYSLRDTGRPSYFVHPISAHPHNNS
jgi:hypothetical protein